MSSAGSGAATDGRRQMVGGGYLPEGVASPAPLPEGLDAPYWEGIRVGALRVQRCRSCATWLWGPEWVCHQCHSFDLGFEDVAPSGIIYSWERVWHPVHPSLAEACPYIVVLVTLPQAGGVRMLGNLLGDARQPVLIDAPVEAVFEHHDAYSLVQWKLATS